MKARLVVAALGAVATCSFAAAPLAWAQEFPSRPIRLIVPYGTGGVTDITARLVAPFMSEALGQQVVVENRGGGASIPGTEAVVKADPDGYTLLLTSTALAANPILFKKMPFDAGKDLAPVSLLSTVPTVLVVNPALPVGSAKDLVAMAKAKPGALNYGSAGYGSDNHLNAAMFNAAAGIEAQHVPYKGGGAVMTDLVGGQISYVFAVLPTALPFVSSGRLKALGVSGPERSGALPDVPTVAEAAGLPGFAVQGWVGIFAPRDTPRPVIDKLNAAASQALKNPELIGKLKAMGEDPKGGAPEALGGYFKEETERWSQLAAKVKFDVAQ
ncbi:Tripartite tricarboxylate transporter family receptor [Pigmentiphaga humi]|uniref:Tripartite tricarboxylate transporter family receptor n=1 Tax=Pigmentiphaga humi TaxID=2478468 RepID=A0A3P4B4G3_9BURK|nr:tripartite tricarboxylate transporter substrate binding protein [Pigmentiphaga humi]VCU70942.1 Tripartite tricarboxylate transporter family receptor [Pigmentiphaga humi]